ncbi:MULTISPECIES: 5,6-dimethylbenzimidazole synthase [unclassified Paracoccus (in: a-proteobacteria)]|uniref:5,6-dimethylbenzimidazole synthase n=1 Tax=unclassified Paracoccus (in: a-proteobacteria) TaxID=2688777 RepID=UPI0012B42DDE|nr:MULTISPECIES: 5,6-dimethylbenzimidazole synthase [unclassified Paracoccus (in: a-proteobacteria)]UXU75986.1 5,6-dimethylbenzimidazole synthase [Paracoccus sp. SMMA_5]UXU81895.1 5,6-dimethylbenzimidazole synthase [Paracoccus sp. SMMA_5_TC]
MQFGADQRRALADLLRWRRDIRHFRPDPIPEALLAELARAMELAPSVGNARPWRVIRIEDPGLRAAIRDDFSRCNAAAAAGYHGQRQRDYRALRLAGLDRAPVWLAVFTEIDPPEGHGLGRATMPQTLRQSTAMAIHSLWLTARAHNLGMGMVSILTPERICALLETPTGWEFSALLCLGWPETHDVLPLLHRKGWQENHARPWLIR